MNLDNCIRFEDIVCHEITPGSYACIFLLHVNITHTNS